MRAGKSACVSSADIRRLKAVVQDRNAPQKHVWRLKSSPTCWRRKILSVSSADIRRLKAVVQDQQRAAEARLAAEIVLLTAGWRRHERRSGCGERPSPRPAFGAGRNALWRTDLDGLVRDKTRPSRIKPLSAEAAERVVALTLGDPPGETTHWTGASMAKRRLGSA